MRTLLCIIAFSVLSSALGGLITKDTTNFILGTWYSVGDIQPSADRDCCMPSGVISVQVDPKNNSAVQLTATYWNGSLCLDLMPNVKDPMQVPFAGGLSYNSLSTVTDAYNAQGIEFSVYNGTLDQNYANNTQQVQINLKMNFFGASQTPPGDTCNIIISKKSSSIVQAATAILFTVSAYLLF